MSTYPPQMTPDNPMMADVVAEYIGWLASESDRSEATRRTYAAQLHHLIHHWEERHLDRVMTLYDLTRSDVIDWLEASRAAQTHALRRSVVLSLSGWLVEHGRLPAVLSSLPSRRRAEQQPRSLSRAEQNALMREAERAVNASERDAARNRDIIMTLLYSGLRVSELLALTPDDVTLSERRGHVVVRRGKGRRERIVPLAAPAREAIAQLTLPLGLSSDRICDIVSRLGERAGLTVTPHTLRHCYARRLAERGTDVATISQLLGHASIETTMLYIGAHADDVEKAVEGL